MKRILLMILIVLVTMTCAPAYVFAASTETISSASAAGVSTKRPAQVKNIKVVKKADGKAYISWNKAKRATRYKVSFKKASSSRWNSFYTKKTHAKIPFELGKKYKVRVKAYNKKKAGKWSVTKYVTLKKLKISKTKVTIEEGETITLKLTYKSAKKSYWTSSKDTVAGVKSGKVTGISPGRAVITACNGAEVCKCTVTVKEKSDPVDDDTDEGSDPGTGDNGTDSGTVTGTWSGTSADGENVTNAYINGMEYNPKKGIYTLKQKNGELYLNGIKLVRGFDDERTYYNNAECYTLFDVVGNGSTIIIPSNTEPLTIYPVLYKNDKAYYLSVANLLTSIRWRIMGLEKHGDYFVLCPRTKDTVNLKLTFFNPTVSERPEINLTIINKAEDPAVVEYSNWLREKLDEPVSLWGTSAYSINNANGITIWEDPLTPLEHKATIIGNIVGSFDNYVENIGSSLGLYQNGEGNCIAYSMMAMDFLEAIGVEGEYVCPKSNRNHRAVAFTNENGLKRIIDCSGSFAGLKAYKSDEWEPYPYNWL